MNGNGKRPRVYGKNDTKYNAQYKITTFSSSAPRHKAGFWSHYNNCNMLDVKKLNLENITL